MYVVAAVVAGVVIGWVRGGRVRTIAEAELRGVWLLAGGAVLQLIAVPFVGGWLGVALLVVSYLLVGGFTVANLERAGMGVVLIGLAMNALVIGVNGGMPVRDDAIVAAGIAERDEIDDLTIGGKRHLEDDDDRLMFLADIIPVPLGRFAQVLSFGDIVMVVGVADVLVNLMRARRPHERSVSQPEQEGSASPGND